MKKISLILYLIVLAWLDGFTQCGLVDFTLSNPTSADILSTSINLAWNGPNKVGPNIFVTYSLEYKLSSGTLWETGCSAAYLRHTCSVTGLVPGAQYDIRAVASTTCSYDDGNGNVEYFDEIRYSNQISVLLKPSPPILLQATSATATSFIINWQSSTSATEYRIDVSDNSAFSSFVGTYQGFLVASTSQVISGLAPNTEYFYRVRAVNGSGASASSTASYITLPDSPVAIAASNITANSFTANWNSMTGIISYRLDVATDNSFSSILSSYSNLSVTGNSQSVVGLASGTTYYYRLRAINASGSSGQSNTISTVTLPITVTLSTITTNTFTVNWTASIGAIDYRLDVSPNSAFSAFVPGFNNLTVTNTSKMVTGLSPGTNYYCRVRSVSGVGTSVNSNVIEMITICEPPLVVSPSLITATSFTANWNSSVGAASYRLDVARDNSFTEMFSDYSNIAVTGITQSISGLTPGTSYYYRVRAVDAGGTSQNSVAQSVLTLPAAPILNIPVSEVSASSIKVQWGNVSSATEYQIDVSTSSTFVNFVPGFNAKVIPSSLNEDIVSPLNPSTTYYIRMRARNATGISENSNIKATVTLASNGNSNAIKIENPIAPSFFDEAQTQDLSVTVSNGIGVVTTYLLHRKNSATEYLRDEMGKNGVNNFSITINGNWVDDFGMQFYFEAKDGFGNTVTTSPAVLVRRLKNVTIPLERFGKDLQNYHIISMPHDLAGEPDPNIETLFLSVMKTYDPTKWRLVKYENGDNVDYEQDGLKVKKMERGQGYWFISKSEVALNFGEAISYDNTVDKPYELTLKKGWNQIGNPFPYNLSWSEVLNANHNPLTVDASLLVYNPQKISLDESDELKVYSGGFVHADEVTTLTLPTTLKKKLNGGRKGNGHEMEATDYRNWIVPITIKQEDITNTMPAIGMNENASDKKDGYDLLTPPRFERYLEFNAEQVGFEYSFARSIVRPHDEYTWNYSIEQNGTESINLLWDEVKVRQLNGRLILHDLTNRRLLDMTQTGAYSIDPKATSIRIYFNRFGLQEFNTLSLGIPYPNPFALQFSLPFDYSLEDNYSATAMLSLFDFTGKKVSETSYVDFKKQGLKEIHWHESTDAQSRLLPGLYLYKLSVIKDNETLSFQGKLIKQY